MLYKIKKTNNTAGRGNGIKKKKKKTAVELV